MVKRKTRTWQERREELWKKHEGLRLSDKQYNTITEWSQIASRRKSIVRTAIQQILRAGFSTFPTTALLINAIPVRELASIIVDYARQFDVMAFEEELYFQLTVMESYFDPSGLRNALVEGLQKADPWVETFVKERLEKDWQYFKIAGRCNRSTCYMPDKCVCQKPLTIGILHPRAIQQHHVNLSLKRRRKRRLLKY